MGAAEHREEKPEGELAATCRCAKGLLWKSVILSWETHKDRMRTKWYKSQKEITKNITLKIVQQGCQVSIPRDIHNTAR